MTKIYSPVHCTDKYSEHSSVIWSVWRNGWLLIYKLVVQGLSLGAISYILDFPLASSKDFLDIDATIECGFTLKRVRDMTITYSPVYRTDRHSKHSWIISTIWPNGWVLIYELGFSAFESTCSHLNCRFPTCFQQRVPWHWSNYRVCIHSETRTWHDKNIQLNELYR